MNSDRWQQIDGLFDAALELPVCEREKFLKETCEGDDELCREVLSLLVAHEKIDDFIESPAMELVGKAVAQKRVSSTDTLIGSEIGPYKIERLLGVGGMGEVYQAQDTRLNRKVALKLLPSHLTLNKESVLRFEREARAASMLNHPNILTIHDIGQLNGVPYIATEYVDGMTLRERLKTGPLAIEESLDIALQITSALKAAHDAGIIHRDIKPENVMLRSDSIVKVLDFGLAKLTEENSLSGESEHITKKEITVTGAVMGTASYMSPEQALGLDVDHRSDIFSFGAVLYEMLAGKQPFKGTTAAATFDAILNRTPQPLTEISEEVPVEFEGIIERALEKKVESRYQSASDIRVDLKQLLRWFDSGVTFHTTSTLTFRTSKAKRFGVINTVWKTIAFVFLAIIISASAYRLMLAHPSLAHPSKKSQAVVQSIAVLPLKNVSNNADNDHFSDGITESLITSLLQIEGLKVISHGSMCHFKGKEVDPKEVGRKLGVTSVLEGSVRRNNEYVRVTVRLVNTEDGSIIWAGETYERSIHDIYVLQDEIVHQLAIKLQAKLRGKDEQTLARQYTRAS